MDNNHNITWHVLLVALLTLLQEINTWWICNLPLFTLSNIECQNFRLRRVKRDLKVNHTLRSLFCMIKCFPKLEKNLVGTQSLFFLVPNFAQMSTKKRLHMPFFLGNQSPNFRKKVLKLVVTVWFGFHFGSILLGSFLYFGYVVETYHLNNVKFFLRCL